MRSSASDWETAAACANLSHPKTANTWPGRFSGFEVKSMKKQSKERSIGSIATLKNHPTK
jgi:hypothetical protein